MITDEMIVYFKNISDKNSSQIDKELKIFSKTELYTFANEILENCPHEINEIFLIIIRELYDDSEEFVDLFCRFLEVASIFYLDIFNSEIIMSRVTENTNVALKLVKSMVNMGNEKGQSAGILLFMIYDKMEEAEFFFIQGLESKNENLQRCSLVCLISIMNSGSYYIDKYLEILKTVVTDISDKNEDRLIFCLQKALNRKPKSFQKLMEREIERRGVNATCSYIRSLQGDTKHHITILKKAIEILESRNCNEQYVDMGLAKVYESDPEFVVKRIKNRLYKREKFKLMSSYLELSIKKIGNGPIIEFFESEIDLNNTTLRVIGESILKDIFSSNEEWISWCEKWKEDKNKENIILKSLGIILTGLMTNKSDCVRDRAIDLVKHFAKIRNLDYEKETKGINLGADKKEGYKNKENAIKALEVLDKIQNPTIKIDMDKLENNLKNAPNLCEAFDFKWLIKNAKSSDIHIINYIFGKNSPIYQSYLENAFSILKESNIKIAKRKIHDTTNNGIDILTEIEIISKLATSFKITPEPYIKELFPKKLDLMIEYNGEKALIEIATVREKQEIRLSHGAKTYIPGDKIKKELLHKFKKQLYEGMVDVGFPVIILLNLYGFYDEYDVMNGIYGTSQVSLRYINDTHQTVEEGFTRENNGFCYMNNSEIVTAIGAYRFDLSKEDNFVGKLYYPLKPPIYKLSWNFRLRLRNALFGNSETSNWRTLLMIPGVTEHRAKVLYSNGIEDISTLIFVDENDVYINGMQREEISRLKSETKRVIAALSTNRINFLNGINAEDIRILQKEGIYLIRQLFEREKIPEGINEWKWSLLIEDAKRILQ